MTFGAGVVTKTLESRGKRRAAKVVKRLIPCDPAVTGQTETVVAGGCQGLGWRELVRLIRGRRTSHAADDGRPH